MPARSKFKTTPSPSDPYVFPQDVGHLTGGDALYVREGGMTLRDYFAAQAVSGWVGDAYIDPVTLASLAYELADRMLAERVRND